MNLTNRKRKTVSFFIEMLTFMDNCDQWTQAVSVSVVKIGLLSVERMSHLSSICWSFVLLQLYSQQVKLALRTLFRHCPAVGDVLCDNRLCTVCSRYSTNERC